MKLRDYAMCTLHGIVRISIYIATALPSIALANADASQPKTIIEIWMPALAALFGGVLSGLAAPIVKDVVIQRINERRSESKIRRQIQDSYLAPLSAAGEKLMWRMSEIFIDSRPHFLLLKTQPHEYNKYKRDSTIYRVASLLGWIRAQSLELSSLTYGGFQANSEVSAALRSIQAALADGHDVEEKRLIDICKLWSIDISKIPDQRKTVIAAELEVCLYSLAGESIRRNIQALRDETELRKMYICHGLIHFLSSKINCKVSDEIVRSNVDQIIGCLVYRESLIYREWQDAIGDSMIVEDKYSNARRYRIIGFDDFQTIMKVPDHLWSEALCELIEDVDFVSVNPLDQRARQLQDLARSTSKLIIAIARVSNSKLVNKEALKQAKKLEAMFKN